MRRSGRRFCMSDRLRRQPPQVAALVHRLAIFIGIRRFQWNHACADLTLQERLFGFCWDKHVARGGRQEKRCHSCLAVWNSTPQRRAGEGVELDTVYHVIPRPEPKTTHCQFRYLRALPTFFPVGTIQMRRVDTFTAHPSRTQPTRPWCCLRVSAHTWCRRNRPCSTQERHRAARPDIQPGS